jgi:3'-phosphoadenosine 5'-phosphosulfate sulfotransferase (PAPS reductase)/FAD synthetase
MFDLPVSCDRSEDATFVYSSPYFIITFVLHVSIPYLNGKFKLFLCLTKLHAMKTYRGVDVKIYVFLASAVVGGELSALLPGRCNPWEGDPNIRRIGCWVCPRTVLDDMEK